MFLDFFSLTVLTGFIALVAIVRSYTKSNDSLHPLVYIGLLLFSLYCFLPLFLFFTDRQDLARFLSDQQLSYVQGLNLLGVISLCAGVMSGERGVRVTPGTMPKGTWNPQVCRRIKQAAIICGILGVAAFLYGLAYQGGLQEAYGRSYKGISAGSGYIREALLLTLPAIAWMMTTHRHQKLSIPDWLWIGLFTLPLMMQGILGSRRGPLLMILIVVLGGWYLSQFRRPPLRTVLVGGLSLGILAFLLVTNRSQLYLGSDFELDFSPTEAYSFHAFGGNEFVYGAGVILNADAREEHYWGKRYFAFIFIRAIPRQLWLSQYEDAAKWLNIPNLATSNAGTGGTALAETLGWAGAVGASPGIIADVWVEFRWFTFLFLFFIGRCYGFAWCRAVTQGGIWIPIYTLMMAFSVYLYQSFEAISFRFLLTAFATWLVWRYGTLGVAKPIQSNIYQLPSRMVNK